MGTEIFSAPGVVYQKTQTLPDACQQAIIPIIGQTGYGRNPQQTFEIFYQAFNDYYFDFTTKNVDWDAIYAEKIVLINDDITDQELGAIMGDMVAPLKDIHIKVGFEEQENYNTGINKLGLSQKLVKEFADLAGLPFPIPGEMLNQTLINKTNEYVSQMHALQWELITDYASEETDIQYAADGLIRWFKNDGLGYLYIGAMTLGIDEDQAETSAELAQIELNQFDNILDTIIADLADVQGLIIDVRNNLGGSDFISLALASRFTQNEQVHVYSKQVRLDTARTELVDIFISPRGQQYLGSIALLTSNTTVSAGEVFTLAMKQLPNVTIIGEPTQGALSDVMDFPLPNGFELGLSNEFYLSPTGEWFEHQGIPVDITIPFFTQQHRNLEIDGGIEAAIELLTQ
mgnify:CR=1 FL=1